MYILCRQKDLVEVLELNIQKDHIHLVISIPPKYSVSSIMGFLKGKLALRLFNDMSYLGSDIGVAIYGAEVIALVPLG